MTGVSGSHGREGPETQQLRSRLVKQLTSAGSLHSATWIDAFTAVPRHVFVPAFFRELSQLGNFSRIDGGNPRAHSDWLRAVYSNDVLLTQIDGAGTATSSSTSPGLMALMLEALDIDDRMSVLEIGTGTGYNAALLCRRLGSEFVTSIDIDQGLVEVARQRLASAGYSPRLAAADGMTGYPPNAPYQRIIATTAVPRIPSAWITQSTQDGRILANLHRELGGGALALLTTSGDHATGRFLPHYGGFMPVRTSHLPAAISLMRAARSTRHQQRETQITGQVLDNPAFAFFAALVVPAQRIEFEPDGQPGEFWLLGADGSSARQTIDPRGTPVVYQHGPRLLWDILEAAHQDWTAAGSPPRQDFGLTVAATGTHTLWHAQDRDARWTLA